MAKSSLRLAAMLSALCALAACERAADATQRLAMADAARTRTPSARAAADIYPSATPAPSETNAPSSPAEALSREALSDPVITERIKSSILTDPGMAGADVSVNTDAGVVSLTGTVRSQEQAAIASAHAQRHDGVMRVDNHLSAMPL